MVTLNHGLSLAFWRLATGRLLSPPTAEHQPAEHQDYQQHQHVLHARLPPDVALIASDIWAPQYHLHHKARPYIGQ